MKNFDFTHQFIFYMNRFKPNVPSPSLCWFSNQSLPLETGKMVRKEDIFIVAGDHDYR